MTTVRLAIRFHLIARVRSVIRGARWRRLFSLTPVFTVIAFGYSSFFVAVQRLDAVPVSIVGARLAIVISLVPFLFVETRRNTRRPVTFFSASGCSPLTALKLIVFSTSGHVLFYSVIVIALIIPVVVRLYETPREAVLHLMSDLTYVLIFRVVSVLVALMKSIYNSLIAIATTVFLLCFTAGQTIVLSRWEYADLVAISLNGTLLIGCRHVIVRIDPVLIQDYLSEKLIVRSTPSRLLAKAMSGLPVEAKIYVRCFLMTAHGIVHLMMSIGSFGYLLVASIIGISQEQIMATMIILTSAGVVLLSAVFVECFENINLSFARMTPVKFSQLTVVTLTPHWIFLGCVVGASSIPLLLTAADVTSVLMIVSQIAFVPFVAWCSAMKFVGRRVLAGLQFSLIAVLTLVAALVAPWLYVVSIVVVGVVLYRGAVRRYESAVVEDAG